jgi:hypothetical protein
MSSRHGLAPRSLDSDGKAFAIARQRLDSGSNKVNMFIGTAALAAAVRLFASALVSPRIIASNTMSREPILLFST